MVTVAFKSHSLTMQPFHITDFSIQTKALTVSFGKLMDVFSLSLMQLDVLPTPDVTSLVRNYGVDPGGLDHCPFPQKGKSALFLGEI